MIRNYVSSFLSAWVYKGLDITRFYCGYQSTSARTGHFFPIASRISHVSRTRHAILGSCTDVSYGPGVCSLIYCILREPKVIKIMKVCGQTLRPLIARLFNSISIKIFAGVSVIRFVTSKQRVTIPISDKVSYSDFSVSNIQPRLRTVNLHHLGERFRFDEPRFLWESLSK